ncbi:MAG: hypothetical protein ACKOWN_02750 [Microbacteriaceae bacterium]
MAWRHNAHSIDPAAPQHTHLASVTMSTHTPTRWQRDYPAMAAARIVVDNAA